MLALVKIDEKTPIKCSTPKDKGKEIPGGKIRGKKRKRKYTSSVSSGSNSELEENLPENSTEVEQMLTESANKNNLNDRVVKKLLKSVVTNDHVLALVKLREEEEDTECETPQTPKITRAKAKELIKESPIKSKTTAPWNIELQPIKQIPVKTRPEVKALIAHDLPDESDDEYQPTKDDVPSDDDQTLESCSDFDSQPCTPVCEPPPSPQTPKSEGPFKVPMAVSSAKKLRLEDEPTIALRTRSKLCLSETPIETIEESFIPPDEPKTDEPFGDVLWNDFINDCFNPAPTPAENEDDEADPEYDYATDQEHSDDDETLEGCIMRITQNEINDLVKELCQGIPDDELFVNSVGKQEPSFITDNDETVETTEPNTPYTLSCESILPTVKQDLAEEIKPNQKQAITRILKTKTIRRRRRYIKIKGSPHVGRIKKYIRKISPIRKIEKKKVIQKSLSKLDTTNEKSDSDIELDMKEKLSKLHADKSLLIEKHNPPKIVKKVYKGINVEDKKILERKEWKMPEIEIPEDFTFLTDQMELLKQQIRQHIQICTVTYLQLYPHPIFWMYAPNFKIMLMEINVRVTENVNTVCNVVNLKPSMELIEAWETTLNQDSEGVQEYMRFMKTEVDKGMKRKEINHLYLPKFPKMFLDTVSASCSVVLYPHLLPPIPFRGYTFKRTAYLPSEDSLIAMGMEQFTLYMDDNVGIFNKPESGYTFNSLAKLIHEYMLPMINTKNILNRISNVNVKSKHKDSPIRLFLNTNTVCQVKHQLLEYNPTVSLDKQDVKSIPKQWLVHIHPYNKRAKDQLSHLMRVSGTVTPAGVELPTVSTVDSATTTTNTNNNNKKRTHKGYRGYKPPRQNKSLGVIAVPSNVNGITVAVNVPTNEPREGQVFEDITRVRPRQENASRPMALVAEEWRCTCFYLDKLDRYVRKSSQKRITDFYKPKRKGETKREASSQRSPREPMTNKLKYLLENFSQFGKVSNESWSSLGDSIKELKGRLCRNIDCKMKRMESPSHICSLCVATEHHAAYSIEEKLSVLEYISKIEMSSVTYPCLPTIYTQFILLLQAYKQSNLTPYIFFCGIQTILGPVNVSLANEFLSFLTPEQALHLNKYKDYFLLVYMEKFIETIKCHIKDIQTQYEALKALELSLITYVTIDEQESYIAKHNSVGVHYNIVFNLTKYGLMCQQLAELMLQAVPQLHHPNEPCKRQGANCNEEHSSNLTKTQTYRNIESVNQNKDNSPSDTESYYIEANITECTIDSSGNESFEINRSVCNLSENSENSIDIRKSSKPRQNNENQLYKFNKAGIQQSDESCSRSNANIKGDDDTKVNINILTVKKDCNTNAPVVDKKDENNAEVEPIHSITSNTTCNDETDMDITKTEINFESHSTSDQTEQSPLLPDIVIKREYEEWTREEDKTILEQLKNIFATKKIDINNILNESTPLEEIITANDLTGFNRSVDEIKARVVTLLQCLLNNISG